MKRLYRCLILTLLSLTSIASTRLAAEPNWWHERGVIDANAPANDFALSNVGQAKFIASAAIAELNRVLTSAGGAGFSLNDLASSSAPANDFAALNIGQLKYLCAPFYDRLAQLGWFGSPAPQHYYPWSEDASDDENNALVLIGQLKYAFSFDLQHRFIDADSDQLPDFWEIEQTGSTATLSGGNQDNDSLSDIEEYYLQSNPQLHTPQASQAQISITLYSPVN